MRTWNMEFIWWSVTARDYVKLYNLQKSWFGRIFESLKCLQSYSGWCRCRCTLMTLQFEPFCFNFKTFECVYLSHVTLACYNVSDSFIIGAVALRMRSWESSSNQCSFLHSSGSLMLWINSKLDCVVLFFFPFAFTTLLNIKTLISPPPPDLYPWR